jgi:hypothetical protein
MIICKACDGTGVTSGALRFYRAVANLLTTYRGDPEVAELTTRLVGRAPRPPIGYDTADMYAAADKIIEVAGLDPKAWGKCEACQGSGESEGDQ